MACTIYKDVLIYMGDRFEPGRLSVEDGVITSVEVGSNALEGAFAAHKFILIPGLVDVHVHFREPGFEYKEGIATGSMAAAHGGYTTVCTMPNLNPCPDSPASLKVQLDAIERDAVVKVIPYGCITKGQKGSGQLAPLADLAPYVVGFSDDGKGVQADALTSQAMTVAASLGKPIVAHCEVNELLCGGYIHDGEYCRTHGHRGICSESEWRQVERDIALAEKAGCQYHVCHVSTKESVELVRRAKARGLRVSCETAPHYLLLTDADLQEDGRFKMNPPLRSAEDRAALVEGIKDGTIDVIATDHAPHSEEEKSRGLAASAMGIVGLECAFPLLYTYLVKPGVISLERLVDLMSIGPRRIFALGDGAIKVGMPADFTIIELDCPCTVDPSGFFSKGHATPFAGWKVEAETVLTVVDGKVAYKRK